ncbi:MAG: hypothetical protein H0W45_01695 [Acidobacteria bacterium]|nr:hypothetical protein [Acidobacteriota bacterium]
MMIPLRKILTERIKLKILRQQIFSLTKIKGGWLKTTHLFCWSVFRPSDRVWYLLRSASGFSAAQFALSSNKIVPTSEMQPIYQRKQHRNYSHTIFTRMSSVF